MAGKITVTNHTMVKEVPKELTWQPVIATTEGYISAVDISFLYAAGACQINKAAAGFTAANFVASDGEMLLVESTSGVNDGLYTIVSDADQQIILGATDVIATESAAAAGTVKLTCVAVFVITPTKATRNLLITYTEGVIGAGEVGMIPCVFNGSFWAAKNTLYTAFAATVATPATCVLFIETAPYMQADGTILFMLKPVGTSSQLYTDHLPAASFIELP